MSADRPLQPGARDEAEVPDARSAERDLVALCLERMEREGPQALDALCRQHPEQAARLRVRVGNLRALGLSGEPTASAPERLGEFSLLARLGGGGMGVVHAARQAGLDRLVAVKLMRPGTLHLEGARERFRREVGVLARLSHPGIVPVHAGGEVDGVPFMAMELVRGATLDEALAELSRRRGGTPDPARLSGRDLLAAVQAVVARRDAVLAAAGVPRVDAPESGAPPPSSARGSGGPETARLYAESWVTTCVRLVLRLAEALAHAHAQGVLHRDIKPSNVMLTPDGRVLLLDFGLAAAEGSLRLTGSGEPLGSPAYMSPEQVRGERGEIDARADVYGLGLTLYEALTLHQPFVTDDAERTRRLVLAARPLALRAVNAAVPRDVEIAVQAAMDLDPRRRYASAESLARDLSNILELRPIEARPPGAALRLRRWTQRRPALATACVLGALLLVAGPLGWELNRRRSLEVVSAARDQTERNFRAALSAIGHVLRDIATEELHDVPRMQQARLVAIDRALELFPELERDRPDDPLVLGERAELHAARAAVLRDLGRTADALAEFQHEVALRRRLAEGAGEDRRVALAGALLGEAKAQHALGRNERALPAYDEALSLLRAACAAAPDDAARSGALVEALADLSETQRDTGLFDAARATLDEAVVLAERTARPDDARALARQARVCAEMYRLLDFRSQYAEAVPWAQRTLAACEMAAAAAPGKRAFAAAVAGGYHAVAQSLINNGRFDEGDAAARAGLAVLDALLRDYPDVRHYRDERSRLADLLGISAGRRGRSDEAVAVFAERVAETDAACLAEPERADLAVHGAEALNNYATALIDSRERFDEAALLVERGLARVAFVRSTPQPLALVDEIEFMLRYNRARMACFADRLEEARGAILEFEGQAGTGALASRYAADLWNELVLAQRRVRAAAGDAGGAVPPAASPPAEEEARGRMYERLQGAIEAGYGDRRELESTPSLSAFRDEPEFRALLSRLPHDS